MPTYQYHCTKCDQDFDVVLSMTENALTTCPKDLCRMSKWGKGKVKKMIGAGAGLIFKGSGFYITDYRSESYKEAAKKDASASAPATSDAKSSSGSESKSAPAKTEAKPAKTESKGKAAK